MNTNNNQVCSDLDQFDERDQQTPGVRPVHNKSLQQNPRYLLLDGLSVGLCEQVEQAAGEIVGVRVGVAELIGDTIEEEVTTLSVEVDSQVLQFYFLLKHYISLYTKATRIELTWKMSI